MILDYLLYASLSFPKINITSKDACKYLNTLFGYSDDRCKRYISLCLFLSIVLSLVSFGLVYVMGGMHITTYTFIYSSLVFTLLFYFFIRLPYIEWKRKASLVESELPMFCRVLGVFVSSKVSFDKSLSYSLAFAPTISKELDAYVNEYSNDLRHALVGFANHYPTLVVKRAISYLFSVYDTGMSGSKLISLSDDLFSFDRHRMNEISSKISLVSVAFVVFAALFPTLLLIALFVFNIQLLNSEYGFLLLFFVIIPLILFALVIIVASMRINTGIYNNFTHMHFVLSVLAVLYVSVIISYLYIDSKIFQILFLVVLSLIVYVISFREIAEQKRLREVEDAIPDALSSISSGIGGRNVFDFLSNLDLGELSKQANISSRQLRSGISEKKVLQDFYDRNPTYAVKRFTYVIKSAYDLGSFSHLSGISEVMLKYNESARYSDRLVSMQKYTLMLGVVLLPILLAITSNVISAISSQSFYVVSEVSFDTVTIPYIGLYDVFSALYISVLSRRFYNFSLNNLLFIICSVIVAFVVMVYV